MLYVFRHVAASHTDHEPTQSRGGCVGGGVGSEVGAAVVDRAVGAAVGGTVGIDVGSVGASVGIDVGGAVQSPSPTEHCTTVSPAYKQLSPNSR